MKTRTSNRTAQQNCLAILIIGFIIMFVLATWARAEPEHLETHCEHAAEPKPEYRILTCQVSSGTKNNHAKIVYECGSTSIVLVADSPGELRMRELVGRTVDLKLEVVK